MVAAVAAAAIAVLPVGSLQEPFGGNGGKVWVEVNAGEPPSESERGNAGSSAAAERVKHMPPGLQPARMQRVGSSTGNPA